MATIEQVAQLRLLIAEPDETTYTDEMLVALIDGSTALLPIAGAAHVAWIQKAAAYSDLVDISEGGSSRKNSLLQKQALAMADFFRGQSEQAAIDARGTRIARLTR